MHFVFTSFAASCSEETIKIIVHYIYGWYARDVDLSTQHLSNFTILLTTQLMNEPQKPTQTYHCFNCYSQWLACSQDEDLIIVLSSQSWISNLR